MDPNNKFKLEKFWVGHEENHWFRSIYFLWRVIINVLIFLVCEYQTRTYLDAFTSFDLLSKYCSSECEFTLPKRNKCCLKLTHLFTVILRFLFHKSPYYLFFINNIADVYTIIIHCFTTLLKNHVNRPSLTLLDFNYCTSFYVGSDLVEHNLILSWNSISYLKQMLNSKNVRY